MNEEKKKKKGENFRCSNFFIYKAFGFNFTFGGGVIFFVCAGAETAAFPVRVKPANQRRAIAHREVAVAGTAISASTATAAPALNDP